MSCKKNILKVFSKTHGFSVNDDIDLITSLKMIFLDRLIKSAVIREYHTYKQQMQRALARLPQTG